jgi:hypothetical protein
MRVACAAAEAIDLVGPLGTRTERPRGRAAEQRDELAALYLIELHSVLCQQARARLQDIELGEDQSGGNGTTPVIRL